MKVTILDRLIGFVAPARGLRRLHARSHLDRAMRIARGFDGASMGGARGAGRQPGGGSANAELVPSLARLRNRSRDLVRNNGYIKHALNIFVQNAVGTTGLVPKFKNKRLNKLWKRWARKCDAGGLLNLAGIQAQMTRAMWESGEVLLRFRNRRPEDGMEVPLQLQVLESDHLDTSRTGPVDGGFCVAGVQFNAIGQRTGYWLFDQHPGEVDAVPKTWTSKFVPASEILHLFRAIDRPGQVRGIPQFAVSIWRARDMGEYQEAELVRKKIEACFAAFVKMDEQGFSGGGVGAGGITQPAGAGYPALESLEPGTINYLRHGEDVTFSAPAASDGYEEHMRMELRALAVGSDLTYEQLTGDYSQVNFTSGRMGKTEFRAMVEQYQWLLLLPMVMERIAERFINTAFLANLVQSRDIEPEDWTAPRIPLLDPLREAEGYAVMVENDFMSRKEVVRQLGQDVELVDAEIQSDALGRRAAAAMKDDGAAADDDGENAGQDDEDDDSADAKPPDKDKAERRRLRRQLLTAV